MLDVVFVCHPFSVHVDDCDCFHSGSPTYVYLIADNSVLDML